MSRPCTAPVHELSWCGQPALYSLAVLYQGTPYAMPRCRRCLLANLHDKTTAVAIQGNSINVTLNGVRALTPQEMQSSPMLRRR